MYTVSKFSERLGNQGRGQGVGLRLLVEIKDKKREVSIWKLRPLSKVKDVKEEEL